MLRRLVPQVRTSFPMTTRHFSLTAPRFVSPTVAAVHRLKDTGRAVLLAAWNPPATGASAAKEVTLTNPLSAATRTFNIDDGVGLSKWIQEQSAGAPAALFPLQDDNTLTKLSDVVRKHNAPVSVTVDAWSLVYSSFLEQRRSVPGLSLPKSLKDAYLTLTKGDFDGGQITDLMFETLLMLHLKFGSGGGPAASKTTQKKLQPIDQLIRVAFRPVRPVMVQIKHLDSGVKSRIKMKVTLFDATTKQQASFNLANASTDPQLAAISTYVSEPNTISVLIPVAGTKPSDIKMILRGMRTRCPTLIEEAASLVPGADGVKDGSSTWELMQEKSQLSHEGLILKIEAFAKKKAPIPKVRGTGTVPAQERLLIQSIVQGKGPTDTMKPTLDSNTSDPRIQTLLDNWNSLINSADRKKREEAAARPLKKFCVIDLETTTKKSKKRVANPFDPANHIVLPGYFDYKGKITIPKKYCSSRSDFRLPSLDDYDVLVGHNIKFDLLHIFDQEELTRFFKRGGLIWDTMYAQYLLTGQEISLGRGLGLDDVARSYGGTIKKLDEVKDAWAAGKSTEEIPIALLTEYLEGDLRNTELIFRAQVQRAINQRQVIIINTRMDSLLCTTAMEYNGLKIDKKKADELRTSAALEAAELKRALENEAPAELGPLKKHFNWSSNSQLSAYFFGGTLKVKTGNRCLDKAETESDPKAVGSVGGERFIGPPVETTCAAHCAFLARNAFVVKSGKVFKHYYEPTLRARGYRTTEPIDEVFADDDIPSIYKTLLCCVKVPSPILVKNEADFNRLFTGVEEIHFSDPLSGSTTAFGQKQLSNGDLSKFLASFGVDAHLLLVTPSSASNHDANLIEALVEKYGGSRAPPIDFVDFAKTASFAQKTFPAVAVPDSDITTETGVADAKQWIETTKKSLDTLVKQVIPSFVEAEKEVAEKFLEELADTSGKKRKFKLDSPATIIKKGHATHFRKLKVPKRTDPLTNAGLLTLFGMTAGGNFDAFERLSHAPSEASITLPGRLLKLYPDQGDDATRQTNRTLRQEALRNFKSAETGHLKVGTEALEWFSSKGDPVGKNILDLRGAEKLLGTYYDDKQGGMMSLVHEDGRLHHELIHVKTATGRLSSANPNCQNIPKGPGLREVFVSRFEDGLCLEADYSQLEVIAMVALSRDPRMTEDIKNQVDFHCKRATVLRPGETYEDVFRKAKIEKIPEYVAARQHAKVFSFQRQYGAGVKALMKSTGLPRETVEKLIEGERQMYPANEDLVKMVSLAVNQYEPTIQDGTRNSTGDFLYKGQFTMLTGSRYTFTEKDIPESLRQFKATGKTTGFSPTQVKNYPVQGFAGEIVQIMLGRLWRHFVKKNNYGGKALLTNTVHDCVWVDLKPEVLDEVAHDVNREMSNVKEVLNELWPEHRCEVDFPVEVVAGNNLSEMKGIKLE